MTEARRNTLIDGEATYHCISRCVRRAFLHGFDRYSGFNYSHRKEWLRDRLIFLSKVFAIEALAYALLDDHQHSMLRTRPDLLAKLTNEQIAHRWLKLYPRAELKKDPGGKLTRQYVKMLCADSKRMKKLRERLGSVSWFMKSLNEFIARRANREDKCKGRFWEGRFRCIRLEGVGPRLSCAIYIDLNPIRAKMAETPETSEYTSAWERIRGLKHTKGAREPALWLAPVKDTEERLGFLPMTLKEYLSVLDVTGRELKKGKRGKIPSHLEPILVRLGIKPESWLESAGSFGKRFSHFAGAESSLLKAAEAVGKRWVKGLTAARETFI